MIRYLRVLAGSSVPEGLYTLRDGNLSYGSVNIDLAATLASVQIISSIDQLNRTYSGTLASGVVGFALLGPLGAVGGMLVGGRKKHIKSTVFLAVLDDGRTLLFSGNESDFAVLTALSASSHKMQIVATPVVKELPRPLNDPKAIIDVAPKKKVKVKLNEDEKLCPLCEGVIKKEARRCKHCKSDV